MYHWGWRDTFAKQSFIAAWFDDTVLMFKAVDWAVGPVCLCFRLWIELLALCAYVLDLIDLLACVLMF